MPLGRGQGIADGKDFDGAVLCAGSAVVVWNRGVGGVGVGGDGADGLKQLGLVRLQLDQQMAKNDLTVGGKSAQHMRRLAVVL
jgi:hypothetical protein